MIQISNFQIQAGDTEGMQRRYGSCSEILLFTTSAFSFFRLWNVGDVQSYMLSQSSVLACRVVSRAMIFDIFSTLASHLNSVFFRVFMLNESPQRHLAGKRRRVVRSKFFSEINFQITFKQ